MKKKIEKVVQVFTEYGKKYITEQCTVIYDDTTAVCYNEEPDFIRVFVTNKATRIGQNTISTGGVTIKIFISECE